MEATTHVRGGRGRGRGLHDPNHARPHSRNKQWVANPDSTHKSGRSSPYHSDSEGKWERGGHRGGRGVRGTFRGSRGKFPNATLRVNSHQPQEADIAAVIARMEQQAEMEPSTMDGIVDDEQEMHDAPAPERFPEINEPVLETKEEREEFWKELVKAREVERKKAIAEGKMDDPLVPKRLEDAICMVGTCMDMCPRFERYRRERESNLDKLERIPGTKRVDHQRAVKMYERASGDKILPSDLRPPEVLQRTLDYLFHDMIIEHGFSAPVTFIRDRSRAVRNDFTIQHNHGPIAIECHDRCARFHILALHLERDNPDYSDFLEEQQLMNTLQSLKEFYEEQRSTYQSPTELEMRVYHRLIHMRDQKERHDDIPQHIQKNPVFQLTTDFRLHVQRKSAPITKTSKLIVDGDAMQIFGKLANVLREQGNVVMIYLVACILERKFGKDAIDDIEGIRGGLSFSDIIDGKSTSQAEEIAHHEEVHEQEYAMEEEDFLAEDELLQAEEAEEPANDLHTSAATQPSTNTWQPQPSAFSSFGAPSAFSNLGQTSQPQSQQASAFSSISATPSAFGTASAFAPSTFSAGPSSNQSAFSKSAFSVPPAATLAGSQPAPTSTSTSSAIPNFFANKSTSEATTSLAQPQQFAPPQTKPLNGFASGNGTTLPKETSPPSSLFGDNQISRKPQLNGFTFPSLPPPKQPDEPPRPANALNPNASVFTPGASGSGLQQTLTPSDQTFIRSSNPSPSPFSLGSAAPPTPAATPGLNGTTAPAPFPPPFPMRARKSSTPPVLPKIDTTNTQPAAIAPPTPTIPPPAPKHAPISLPGTPTVGPQPPNPLLYRIHDQLKTPLTATPTDMLSPIALQSPSPFAMPSLQNFPSSGKISTGLGLKTAPSPMITSPTKPAFLSQLSQPPLMPEPAPVVVDEAALEAKADEFLQRSHIVKSVFMKWHQHILERAAYLEAVQQGDKYSKKIKRQRLSEPDRKRKVSSLLSSTDLSPTKKRTRRRVSSTYKPPRTDDDLVQRLKENHAEHERRWAPGTFLQVIKNNAWNGLNGSTPNPSWRAWLSMNPDNDATAIWLERKFDVPTSGSWVTEAIFALSLSSADESSEAGFPGLIIFECTPFEDVTDEIERKYRILDDCSRLRDIVAALPSKRLFKPSLLLLSWTPLSDTNNDLTTMIKKLLHSGTIKSYDTLSISTTNANLDEQLGSKLTSLNIDLQGELARALTWPSVIKTFGPQYASFTSEWIDNCTSHGHFNWRLFSELVAAVAAILNQIAALSGELTGQDIPEILSPAEDIGIVDDSSAFEKILAWLANTEGESATKISFNLQSRWEIGHEFPVRDLIDQLWSLVQSESWHRLGSPNTKYYVLKSDIAAATNTLKQTLDKYQRNLGQTLHLSVRRSPASVRRRSVSQDTDLISISTKRPRLSSPTPTDSIFGDDDDLAESDGPEGMNGRLSPTPSVASVAPSETPAPVVTLAMLRALTKDMKKKYGSSA